MNRRILLVVAPLMAILLTFPSAVVHGELPGYPTYAVPSSLKDIMVGMIGNATISGSNGSFTISDVPDNQTTIILLNQLFAYEIAGTGLVGLAFENGTVAVNFCLQARNLTNAQRPIPFAASEQSV